MDGNLMCQNRFKLYDMQETGDGRIPREPSGLSFPSLPFWPDGDDRKGINHARHPSSPRSFFLLASNLQSLTLEVEPYNKKKKKKDREEKKKTYLQLYTRTKTQ